MADGDWVRRELTTKEDLPGRFHWGGGFTRLDGFKGGSTLLAYEIDHMCILFQISGGGELV